MRSQVAVVLCLLSLVGCGGGGDSPPPVAPAPPPVVPPPPPPPPVIGLTGGTITDASGAAVIFPAGAVESDTTFRIAMDSTGAPSVPSDLTTAGNVYVITPHGGNFAQPVEVRIPAPTVTLQPDELFKIATAEPGGEWIILDDTKLVDGMLGTEVSRFSYFRAAIIKYSGPLVSIDPLQFTTTLTCNGGQCDSLMGPVNASYTVLSNNGQMPANCDANSLFIGRTEAGSGSYLHTSHRTPLSKAGGSSNDVLIPDLKWYQQYGIGMVCGGVVTDFGSSVSKSASWRFMPLYPRVAVLQTPAQIDVVEGTTTNLDVILGGGAAGTYWNNIVHQDPLGNWVGQGFIDLVPSATDRAVVDWMHGDQGGTSWLEVAHSYQDEGNPLPFGVGVSWQPWSVRHSFIAFAADQGAMIRVRACYTPSEPYEPGHPNEPYEVPPCVTGPATRINILQQSAPPAVVGQPRSVLIRTAETANFSVTVSGQPAPTLQWQTRPANSTGEWTNVAVGTGATSASYITAPRVPSDNGEQYRVVATNSVGSISSTPVTVSVSDLDVAPSITTQPASLAVTSGNDAVFAVVAYGTEALSYQWRFNGTNIAGANNPVLRLNGVTGASAGSYSVTVTNNAGNAVSSAAVLNVTAGTPVAVAPSIVTQPASVTVNVGNTATFAVGVDGSGPLSFQWRRDGVNIAGATSASLTFNSVALPNAGSYSVLVTNSAGSVASNSVTLDVASATEALPPTITSQPSTVIVPLRGSANMAVGATGSGPLSYQWMLNGAAIPGATAPVLSFYYVRNEDVAQYTVQVSNSVSSTMSQAAELILLGAPQITQDPGSTTAIQGQTATFDVTVDGSALRYQWLLNGNPISGAIDASYTTPTLVANDSGGIYSVMVYNGAGLVISQTAVLTVQTLVAPTITQHPQDVTIEPGQQAQMCVTIGGTPTFDVQLQRWNGSAWALGTDVLVNNNTQVCYFTAPLTLADNGAQYRFLVDNPAGEVASNTATVTVQAPVGNVITTTTLASRATSGATANNRSGLPSLSADGNIVAFISDGTNLVPGATNSGHGYVRNLATGVTTLIDQTPAGTQSLSPYGVNGMKLAAGGRYVIFSSLAGDLVADDTNGSQDVFVRDLQAGTTRRVSLLADGSQITNAGGGQSDMQLNISADGRFVSFVSNQDLIGDDPSGAYSLYFRNLQTGFTRRVFSSTTSMAAYSTMSDDGEHMAYLYATFVPGATRNIIVHYDAEANASTEAFSIDSTNNESYVGQGIGISGNGRYITFALRSPTTLNGSNFTQVLAIDQNNPGNITVASGGSFGFGNGNSSWPKVSDDGHVLFMTNAGNLTANFTSAALVVRDLQSTALSVASRRPDGTSIAVPVAYAYHALSSDGTVVAFAADEFDMSGGTRDNQVYVAPRP
jgi:Immunoglobulin I-set domain/Immunoglobulin domain/WD40-like Beta Propeller Repeat